MRFPDTSAIQQFPQRQQCVSKIERIVGETGPSVYRSDTCRVPINHLTAVKNKVMFGKSPGYDSSGFPGSETERKRIIY
ncbi:hypothetical protein DBV15_05714 [Temnothorax longispinosus]|uniref:Uncharacterized protein n=1 Tax=Temnothorax longispinosus TaxID=300112 RepID=A0A4S2JA26_9HYME|nr:hypothetical protein DBV15_05714 [Temnothorax longispinosus]